MKPELFPRFPRRHSVAWYRLLEILLGGGIVLAPTNTIMGLFVAGQKRENLERLRAIKGRSIDKPFILFLNRLEQLDLYIDPYGPHRPWNFRQLLTPFTTVIFRARADGPLAGLGYTTIGIRFPRLSGWGRLIDHLAERAIPLLCTSANFSGEEVVTDSQNGLNIFGDKIAAAILAPLKRRGIPSTLIDLTADPKILRGRLNQRQQRILCKKSP